VGCQPPGGWFVDSGDAVTLEHVLEHRGKASRQRHDHGEPDEQCDTDDLVCRQPAGQWPFPDLDLRTRPCLHPADHGNVAHPCQEPGYQTRMPSDPNRRRRQQYQQHHDADADQPETLRTGSVLLPHDQKSNQVKPAPATGPVLTTRRRHRAATCRSETMSARTIGEPSLLGRRECEMVMVPVTARQADQRQNVAQRYHQRHFPEELTLLPSRTMSCADITTH
jgi:hypothetical protein